MKSSVMYRNMLPDLPRRSLRGGEAHRTLLDPRKYACRGGRLVEEKGISILWLVVVIAVFTSFLLGKAVWAAPSITSVAGSVSSGQAITITGTSFGSTGPTIAVFDNFENGTTGKVIAKNGVAATVGAWTGTYAAADSIGASPFYSNTHARSGSLSMLSDWSTPTGQEGYRHIYQESLGGSPYIYFSWWAYLPAGRDVPGTNSTGGPNWKLYWVGYDVPPSGSFVSDYVTVILTNTLPITNCGIGYSITGCADASNCPSAAGGYNCTALTKGVWTRYEAYLVSSTSSGVIQLWETNANQTRTSLYSYLGATTTSGYVGWNKIHFPGYGRYDGNSQTYYDDIYVATGVGARARVEIGNASTYSSCTDLAVITPTSWSNTSIVATVRSGSFSSGQAAYLFVIDASGNASVGYPVTIGGLAAPNNFRKIGS